MRRKEMEDLLSERAERIVLLETRISNMQSQLENYQKREQSIVDSLANANDHIKRQLAEAQQQADALLSAAEEQANGAIALAEERAARSAASAEGQANALLNQARQQADEWMQSAQAQADELVLNARQQQAEALQMLERYNGAVAACAASAQAYAEQFSTYMRSHPADPDSAPEDAFSFSALHPSMPEKAPAPVEEDTPAPQPDFLEHPAMESFMRAFEAQFPPEEPLPEPDTPAQVMQNIYKLQNRAMPGPEEAYLEDYAPRPEPDFDPAADSFEEWQPEPEPEADLPDVPTVSELMPDTRDDTDISLDALLDEIIRAGE